jgi:hypothetical protein
VKEGVKRKGDNNVYSSIYAFYWSMRRDKSRGVYRKLSEEMRVRNREKKTSPSLERVLYRENK